MAMADCAWGQANDLPRHAVIGLQVAPPDLNKPEDPVKNPPTIKSVIPDGAGEMAGIQVGDILLAVDDAIVRTSSDFAKRISRHLSGDSVNDGFDRWRILDGIL